MRSKLISEAQYYQFSRITFRLIDEYDPFVLAPADFRMHKDAEALRNALACGYSGYSSSVASADSSLVDVLAHADDFVFRGRTQTCH